MNYKHICDETHHKQKNKFTYVIRNTGTGAYLCDTALKRKVFPSYKAAEQEKSRLNLSSRFYETVVLL